MTNLLLTADWHLREDHPPCRIEEDFKQTQFDKLQWIYDLSQKHNAHIVHAGDVFHKAKPSLEFMRDCYFSVPNIHSIPGNHDLPNHNPELESKSGYGLLNALEKIENIGNAHRLYDVMFISIPFGSNMNKLEKIKPKWNCIYVLVLHEYVYQNEHPIPGQTFGSKAIGLLKKYPQFELIVTGDNHQSFFVNYEGRTLVNPGCLTRQNANEIDYTPKVYIYDTVNKKLKIIKIPINKGYVSREHIEPKEQQEERISAFVESLKDEIEIGLSFDNNLKQYIKENNLSNELSKKIWECVEGDDQ